MIRTLRTSGTDYFDDFKGTQLYGPGEEKLGTIDDGIIDDRTGDLKYLVVNSVLKSHRFIVPADQVFGSDRDDVAYANLRQRDAENLPEFRNEVLASDDAFLQYEKNYRNAWRYDADHTELHPIMRLECLRERIRSGFSREATIRRSAEPVYRSGISNPVTVYGVYADREHVERAIERLREAGISSSDVSAVFPNRKMTEEFALEKNTKAPEGALAGGGAGLVIGGALGWLAGIGSLAIPGIGPIVAAGPIIAAITGAGVGSAIGGIAGALIGLGVPEIEAKRYEEEIKRGRTLLSVRCDTVRNAQGARKVLDDTGAKDVFLSGEQRAA